MQEFFTRTRLTEKQPGHRLWVNNKETRQTPPDLDNLQPDTIVDLTVKEEITMDNDPIQSGIRNPLPLLPPLGLEQPIPHPQEMHQETMADMPTSRDTADKVADSAPYKPTHRMLGKQTPPQQPVRAI
eukprot:4115431-Amphidinium_carterae.1